MRSLGLSVGFGSSGRGSGEGLGYHVCPPTCSTLHGEQSRLTGVLVGVGVVKVGAVV